MMVSPPFIRTWVSMSPLKYFTVFTRSSMVASSSQTMQARGCCWIAETVHMCETPSSMHFASAMDLAMPIMMIKTSRASITVPTPTVSAIFGTMLRSPPKNRELATIVSYAKVLILVRDVSEEPGSLKAMCPSGPIPPKNSSIPPTRSISSSNLWHSSSRSLALPSRI